MAKRKRGYAEPEEIKNVLFNIFKGHALISFSINQLGHQIRLKKEHAAVFDAALAGLVEEKKVQRLSHKRYKLNIVHYDRPAGEGIIMMSRNGFAFVPVEGYDEDIFIGINKLHGALHGDRVRLSIAPSVTKRRTFDGEVLQILERSKRPYIGIVQITDKDIFVITDSRYMPYDIRVSPADLNGAENGQKVAVMINGWSDRRREPVGRISEVLGNIGDNDTEMHAILTEFGLPYRFSAKIEKDAEKIPGEITADDIAQRRDFRGITTFTIDPSDAKDFDDALSIKKLNNGNWEVGVHIADVTHYVLPNTLVEKEAAMRATSVYLVDRTVSMLPERLSNELCSLRPNEDKLCYSAVFELDKNAEILNRWVGRTIIRSDHRFDYDSAQQVIETKKGTFAKEIQTLHKLAQLLRSKRFENGALLFDQPESKVKVDEKGKPVDVFFREMKDSNFLIEEFMLLANCNVAEMIATAKPAKTFVYRVHDEPTVDRLKNFRDFIRHLGYKMPPTKTPRDIAKAINKLLETAKNKPEYHAMEIMALRTMARAVYSTDNIGHYGLATDYYTHFTSPIRRYPDMMVHRLLTTYLAGGASENKAHYQDLCKYASQREQLAADAERASIKFKMVEFMQGKEGEIFDGTVSGVTEYGIYVEVNESGVEGYVPQREMRGDYYSYIPERYMFKGRHTGKTLTYGDLVRVKLVRARLDQKLLDFSLIED
ncbi:MAG: ribonuclease R [Prevotellaceae bacterium]|jgi:ribonuclease R|nr:ribonuclease R [Prevotellaceae bacterium]